CTTHLAIQRQPIIARIPKRRPPNTDKAIRLCRSVKWAIGRISGERKMCLMQQGWAYALPIRNRPQPRGSVPANGQQTLTLRAERTRHDVVTMLNKPVRRTAEGKVLELLVHAG